MCPDPFADADDDGRLDISDPLATALYLYVRPVERFCSDAADANDDGRLDLTDVIYGWSYMYLGGPAPAAPFPAPGNDPTPDGLGCEGL